MSNPHREKKNTKKTPKPPQIDLDAINRISSLPRAY